MDKIGKIKYVKCKTTNDKFYVQWNDKSEVWDRIDIRKTYTNDDLIFIRSVD
jgi:hypothetical protein